MAISFVLVLAFILSAEEEEEEDGEFEDAVVGEIWSLRFAVGGEGERGGRGVGAEQIAPIGQQPELETSQVVPCGLSQLGLDKIGRMVFKFLGMWNVKWESWKRKDRSRTEYG